MTSVTAISAFLFVASLMAALAGESAMAQPGAERFRLGEGAKINAEQREVVDLLNKSAATAQEGRIEEGAAFAEKALERARAIQYRELEGYALHNLAQIEIRRGNIPVAERLLRRARLLFEIEGNLVGQANIRLELAEIAGNAGRTDESRRLLESSKKLAEAAGDKTGLLNVSQELATLAEKGGNWDGAELGSLIEQAVSESVPIAKANLLRQQGRQALRAGRQDEAEQRFTAALQVAQEAKDSEAESHALRSLGELAEARGRHKEALDFFTRALESARRGRHTGAEGNALLRLAELYGLRGDFKLEQKSAEGALAAFTSVNQAIGVALAHMALAESAWRRGDAREAGARFRESIAISAKGGYGGNEARARMRLASFLRGRDLPAAKVEIERALSLYRATKDSSGEADALHENGRIIGAEGKFEGAIESFKQSRAIYSRLNSPGGEARVDLDLGTAANLLRRYEEARPRLVSASAFFEKIGSGSEQAKACYQLGIALAALGDTIGASKSLTQSVELARRAGNSGLATDALLGMSKIEAELGRNAEAVRLAKEALAVATKANDKSRIDEASAQLRRAEGAR
jgi:tetratricopeptide (TPR) repeat protein